MGCSTLPPAPWEDFWGILRVPFAILSIQMVNWISRPQTDFKKNAAAGFVLLFLALLFNVLAFHLRYIYRMHDFCPNGEAILYPDQINIVNPKG